MEERHPYRLVRDLFEHKEAIFGELKRQASSAAPAQPSTSAAESARQRAVSNADEGSRRAAMEARARAINSQRAKSPAPTNRHRRDKSTDGSVSHPGRFPVVASPRPDAGRIMGVKRASLEVPGSAGNSPVTSRHNQNELGSSNGNGTSNTPPRSDAGAPAKSSSPEPLAGPPIRNGAEETQDEAPRSDQPTIPSPDESPVQAIPDGEMPGAFTSGPGPHIPPPVDDDVIASSPQSVSAAPAAPENKGGIGSLRRSAGATGSGRRQAPSGRYGSLKARSNLNLTGSVAEEQTSAPGVRLEDRPMDDDFS